MKPGVVIGGRYRLVEPLASGGMGTVWRARHVELDVDVAVKLMSDALSRTPTALARFQREAKAAAQLKSPHVVQVFDYGVEATRPYLAMELLEGEDLRTHLGRVGAMPLDRIAKVLDGLAKALRLAHAAGIVHRDLKPANVFLQRSDGDEVVKILDFGIAKDLGPVSNGLQTSESSVVGSPLYMSPEQVRGAEVDHRTDIWSLAVIAFEMATGRQPFEGASLGDVFARIVADDIPRATTIASWLPTSIDGFFERALARKVDRRFATANELADAFRAMTGDTVSREARPVGAHRVLPDAPTIDASLPNPDDAVARRPSAVAAHTSAREVTSPETVELVRTVATPPPSVAPTPSFPSSPSGSHRAVIVGVVVAALGIAVIVALSVGSRPDEATSALPETTTPASGTASPASAPSPQVRVAEPSASTSSPAPSASTPAPAMSASTPQPAPNRPPTRPPVGATAAVPPTPQPSPTPPPAAAAKPTTAIDPIFGVPVKKP